MNRTTARGRMRVGIDNYGLFPLGLDPLDTLRWAVAHGAEGVAFSGLQPEHQAALDAGSLAQLKGFAQEHSLYLEWGGAQHVPRDLVTWTPKDIGRNEPHRDRAGGRARHAASSGRARAA